MKCLPLNPWLQRFTSRSPVDRKIAIAFATIVLCAGCGKPAAVPPTPAVEVTVLEVEPHDTPVDFEFTAQTQSSREVEIRARVDGFLDKRVYTEGQLVHTGQVLFLMDPKPFEAVLQTAKGQLAQQQARLYVAKANLARVIPLTRQNALSQKDLDDATGNEKEAESAVIAAQGQVQTAELNLSYTTIKSPLTGLSSFARQQDGSYVTATAAGLLTYVYQLDPMWVNFSISENELLRYRDQIEKKQLIFPASNEFEVTVVLADGTVFPDRGRINFTNPAFNTQTGTFLVRASFANAKGMLRPGQFVKARVSGAIRPNAILVPQRAVLQGAKSHFVWVVDNDSKAHERVVETGEWHGDDWFITDGLQAGDRVVVDGAIRVIADTPLKITGEPKPSDSTPAAATVAPGGEPQHLAAQESNQAVSK
ncbi:efflux RND transporter periplasmic adaptor subunit [Paraburkholderia phenazinium]|uniref:Membrane fusion protein, multidrug efflux system n=1 Tax=Paraburkholderia phenazinium TaxID=60549 RepID=A0A1G8LJI3_9BURK|nr:efflux RND transporter periplasmic adaptor subunit [Paraburkholderia phenazinium]SDI55852.1 membrane fusion protein, multidrug efflux system [Paraburkholderia phenazinium]